MSQLVYLIVRYSAPGVMLSSLTKKEAASRLNLKSTQLNGLLTKLIKAELISIEPFSFIAPTEKFWESGCPTTLEKMFTYSPAESSPAKISEVQESALRFISNFNDLKVHNLHFTHEKRMHALKNLPFDIRSVFQPALTSYVQDIKTKVLTIERGW
ncbi:hypothetical protein QTN94_18365 [Vibrio sp. M250220]|uniref:hypothetical protein n=1 Tax=Vibrio sp. M250220 TaxID=3020894 RepID=UPI002F429DB3